LPLALGINSEIAFDSSSVKVIFSKDYFTTRDSVSLTYNHTSKKFTGDLPVNNHLGIIQYYFKTNSVENKLYKLPSVAPGKKLSFRIGPDYSPPYVQHNPVKVISKALKTMDVTATANDNLGVKSVTVEYKLDGVLQEPVNLTVAADDLFSGTVEIPEKFLGNNKIEYRIVADDKSKNGNKITIPSNGFYHVDIYDPYDAVTTYQSDFNEDNSDFITGDFEMSEIPGFSSGILHTKHPYTQSALETEKYNLITQLKYPIIIEEYGQMSFNEIVLVEPGDQQSTYKDLLFWDYVIVEGSKDNGKTWLPVTEGYDSNSDNTWYSNFVNSLTNGSSTVSGNESMFVKRTINLTEDAGFSAGDIVIFRFRLSSDKSVNGWGWAIDDLKIQDVSTKSKELASEKNIDIYPNPFSGNFYVDCSNTKEISSVDILVTDLMGKTVFQEMWSDPQFNSKKQINLTNIRPGIYLVNMVTDASQIITKKIVKY
jgi:hypothetical protein